MIDLPSLAPLSDSRIEAAGAAWALAADPARGLLYVADELATEIRVFDVQTGRIAAASPLAFSLRVEVRDEDDKPPPSAVVHLLWSIRGREVLVRDVEEMSTMVQDSIDSGHVQQENTWIGVRE